MKTGTLHNPEGARLGRSPPRIVLIFSCCQKLNRHKQQSKSLVSEDLTRLNCHMKMKNKARTVGMGAVTVDPHGESSYS